MTLVHGTCVEIDGTGILIQGPSGSGKSDLALRLIDTGAQLVSDDQTLLTETAGKLIASSPDTISGVMEVRGIGLIHVETQTEASIGVIIDLVNRDAVSRLPVPNSKSLIDTAPDIRLPVYQLHAFDSSTPAKVRLAVQAIQGNILLKT
ncbi:MAG: HPr kinase/phosphorylase [Rhodospirillales bacterium]|jgi:HPr kinase/phosphorylase